MHYHEIKKIKEWLYFRCNPLPVPGTGKQRQQCSKKGDVVEDEIGGGILHGGLLTQVKYRIVERY